MASGVDKTKIKRYPKRQFAPWTSAQRRQMARKRGWNNDTWAELRARTQALADAAAPGDRGKDN